MAAHTKNKAHKKKKKDSRSKLTYILRWIGYGCIAIVSICIIILSWFRIISFLRESMTPREVAPKTGRFVHAADVDIYIQEMGPSTGPAVLFTHGFGAWSETWKKPMEELAHEGYHTIAMDVPPFGFSQRPSPPAYKKSDQARRIIGVLDALKIGRVTLVSHSYGGGSAMEAAFTAPERFERLVLVDVALSIYDEKPQAPSPLMTAFFAIKPLRNAVLSATLTNPMFTKSLLSSFVYDPSDITPEKLHIYQMPYVLQNSTNDLGDWLTTDMFAPPVDSYATRWKMYTTLAMPVLLIWGDKDTVTPLWQAQYLQKLIPHVQLTVIPDAGHIPQIEDIDRFNTALVDFLAKTRTP